MTAGGVILTVVAPAHNEEGNIDALVAQVGVAAREAAGILRASSGQRPAIRTADPADPADPFEFIIVDDGSTDSTRARALALRAAHPWLRIVAMQQTPPGRGNGQSAAFHAGFRAAHGAWIATIDADLQNNPADLIAMAKLVVQESADMVQGDRSASRRQGDSPIRQIGSVTGRHFRRVLLSDTIRDTGCSLRLMRREIALRLPLEFRGAHRFIPVTARQLGFTVLEMPVAHRQRHSGTTKYGMGIVQRAIPGLIDCLAIRWMRSRRRPIDCLECDRHEHTPHAPAETPWPADPTAAARFETPEHAR